MTGRSLVASVTRSLKLKYVDKCLNEGLSAAGSAGGQSLNFKYIKSGFVRAVNPCLMVYGGCS